MPAERPLEAWEEAHRRGQDLADRLAQGFNGLLQSNVGPPYFPWAPPHQKAPFDLDLPSAAAALDIGGRLGRAGAEIGACVSGVAQHFLRHLPAPFRPEEAVAAVAAVAAVERRKVDVFHKRGGGGEFGLAAERLGERVPKASVTGRSDESDEEGFGFELGEFGHFKRPQGSVNITSTYDSRTHEIGSSFVAKGDLWRVEVSHGGSASGNENLPLTLVQLGPILFVRDSTLLLPVHLSKQRLLWYGYDRKNGMHSLCPALWSKDRRWLLMSMICLNPPSCSFMDLQFPNGQLTYVAGEGLAGSAFIPIFGGLLQAQGRYPGERRISFSCKNKRGTRITPMVQWPDKSFSLGVAQAIAWTRSGLIVRPSLQVSLCPTFGGSNHGVRAELIHSVKEDVNLICGGSCTAHPSVFASLSLGRSKWNGHVGSSGIVFRVEKPLTNIGRPSLSIQLNGGFEF